MKKILINRCPDSQRWYAYQIGKLVPYLPHLDSSVEYGSRQQEGYINFVMKEDGEIIELNDEGVVI